MIPSELDSAFKRLQNRRPVFGDVQDIQAVQVISSYSETDCKHCEGSGRRETYDIHGRSTGDMTPCSVCGGSGTLYLKHKHA